MNLVYKFKLIRRLSFLFILSVETSFVYAQSNEEDRIRTIVQGILKEKDNKISLLEQRINQLESGIVTQEKPSLPAVNPIVKTETTAESKKESFNFGEKLDELKKSASESGLEFSGFFDVNAKTGNSTDQTFSVGSVEIDLDYSHDEHFGVSTALVLCGNSMNTDSSAPAAIYCGNSGAGGLSGGSTMAGFAAAMLDYHVSGDKEPPRGRLFDGHSVHVQVGRFDLPFGSDYQNFANRDRITVTAPLTTSRMQMGGYNSDGVRSYGAWKMFNYSVYWTDALYANDGHTIGGRLGLDLDESHEVVHRGVPEGIEIGVSHLSELDGNNNIRNSVYGADLSVNYDMWHWQNEVMYLQGHQNSFIETGENGFTSIIYNFSNTASPFGKNNQLGYHSTFVTDLENITKHPILAFARFSRWQPSQNLGLDFDGSTVAVGDISMVSLGVNYKLGEHLAFKFEYNDSLGTKTKERYFDEKMGIGQMIMSF